MILSKILLFLIGFAGVILGLWVIGTLHNLFFEWILPKARRKKPKQQDEPSVNDLPVESLEHLVNIIGEDPTTDYELKILARYELVKNKGSKEDENTLPEGFTIEYNSYVKIYYPKYGERYLYRIEYGKIYDHYKKIGGMDIAYCYSKEEDARNLIDEYYNVNLGNAPVKIIK